MHARVIDFGIKPAFSSRQAVELLRSRELPHDLHFAVVWDNPPDYSPLNRYERR